MTKRVSAQTEGLSDESARTMADLALSPDDGQRYKWRAIRVQATTPVSRADFTRTKT